MTIAELVRSRKDDESGAIRALRRNGAMHVGLLLDNVPAPP